MSESELFTKYKSSYSSAVVDLSIHTCVMSASFYLVWLFQNSWLSIFTIPLVGLVFTRTFIIFHDCQHNSYTPNKTINYIISTLYGITVFTSPNWILDHHTHHLTNGNIENEYRFKFNEIIYYNVNQYKKFNTFEKKYLIFFIDLLYFSQFPPFYIFLYFNDLFILLKKSNTGKKCMRHYL